MYYSKLFDELFSETNTTWENHSTTFVPSKFAVDVQDDIATIALSVLGHDPKNIDISCYEDKIHVKAKKEEGNKTFNKIVADIDETIRVSKVFDGTKAKADIKNGILLITLEKREEAKPKKLTLKVG
ncbi:MAG: Hsp20/alpha crystallin family protein [Candidatus Fonsibacter ubiquis]